VQYLAAAGKGDAAVIVQRHQRLFRLPLAGELPHVLQSPHVGYSVHFRSSVVVLPDE
jgi:hypothetical protein